MTIAEGLPITIHETNRQKLFDAMLDHLRLQGQPAITPHEAGAKCMYRTDNGLKCAIGALIPDELYRPGFEEASTSDVLDECGVTDEGLRDFLTNAQANLHDIPVTNARYIGDCHFLSYVEQYARHLATRYNLIYTPPADNKETA